MKIENKNFLINVIYQMLIYVFPLITIPYISRVLGVENIGIYSYTFSIVSLFMLVGMLGITNYGNRSIASVRDNKNKVAYNFWSIYNFQLFISGIVCFIYLAYIFLFVKQYNLFFMIQFIQLLSVCLDINWFYFGLEKFKITVSRNLIIKIFSIFCIFLFVHDKSDLWKYTLIMSLSVFISQLYLILNLKKYISYVKVSFKESLSNLRGCLILFIPVLAYGIYRIMDKTMLGNLSSVVELGYYENAERIINIPISVINALGTVMLPRMSYLMAKEKNGYKEKITESMNLALLLSCIMSMGLILIGDDVAIILFGEEFLKSGFIIKLLSFTILFSSWANVIRTQYLIPSGNDKIYVLSTVAGALINLFSNFLFIPMFGSVGACIGTILAEFFVMLYQTICVRKVLDIKKYCVIFLKNIVKSIIIVVIVGLCISIIESIMIRLSAAVILSIILTIVFNYKYIFEDFLGIKIDTNN